MDLLEFWGAAAWCNRAFFIAGTEVECDTSTVEGVLELYTLPEEICQNSSFDYRSFYADYDQRCFGQEMYYGIFCRGLEGGLEKSAVMSLENGAKIGSGGSVPPLSNTVFNGCSAGIYRNGSVPFDRDTAGCPLLFDSVRQCDNAFENSASENADVFSGGRASHRAAVVFEKCGSVLEREFYKNGAIGIVDLHSGKNSGIGAFVDVGVVSESAVGDFGRTGFDLWEKIGGAAVADRVNRSVGAFVFGRSELEGRGAGGTGRVELGCFFAGEGSLCRDLRYDLRKVYGTDRWVDRNFVNGGDYCNLGAGVSYAVIGCDPVFDRVIGGSEFNGVDGVECLGESGWGCDVFSDRRLEIVSKAGVPASWYYNADEMYMRLGAAETVNAYSVEKGDAAAKFCCGSGNVYGVRVADFETNAGREMRGIIPQISEAVGAVPKFSDAVGVVTRILEAAGEVSVRSDSDLLVCSRELRELRNVVLQGSEGSARCFTSANIKIDISGGGAFNGEINMDELAQKLSEAIGEVMVNTSEGVHYI